MAHFISLVRNTKGVTAVEYALAAYAGLGSKVQTQFHDVDSNLGAHL